MNNIVYTPKNLRLLTENEACEVVNKRLREIYEQGLTTADIKCDYFDLSNATVNNIMKEFGYIKEKRQFRPMTEEEKERILVEQAVPTQSCQSNAYSTKIGYNVYDVIRHSTSGVKTVPTSVSFYEDTYNDWNAFCETHFQFNKKLLYDAALRMFMNTFIKESQD